MYQPLVTNATRHRCLQLWAFPRSDTWTVLLIKRSSKSERTKIGKTYFAELGQARSELKGSS